MIETELINVEKPVRVAITCDVCKKRYDLKDVNTDPMDVQEFIHIDTTGGYGSVFGDCTRIMLDMCQHCFKERLGEFVRTSDKEI